MEKSSQLTRTSLPNSPRVRGRKKTSTAGTQAKTVEKLEVHARRASTLASSATKSDTPLIETAQSVTVITRNEMDIRNVLNLNQAVRYTAGITADLRGGGVGHVMTSSPCADLPFPPSSTA
nr:TonB-dependent receptor plug domain-containing protein [Gluconobacter oxydans]